MVGRMIKDCEEIKNCIACGSEDLVKVLDLNEQPLANSYKKSVDEPEPYFPLAINRCEHCFHVQLTHRVNPDLMFKDYAYVSGTAKTQLEYFEWFAEFAKEKFGTMPSTVLVWTQQKICSILLPNATRSFADISLEKNGQANSTLSPAKTHSHTTSTNLNSYKTSVGTCTTKVCYLLQPHNVT